MSSRSFFLLCALLISVLLTLSHSTNTEDWDREQSKWFDYVFDPHYDVPSLDTIKGAEIPQLGFGTYLAKGETLVEALKFALRLGYRHIDTALSYNNHEDVGRAIGSLGIPRNQMFITSKIPASMFGYNETLAGIDLMRRQLDVRQIDLCLVHHPITSFGGNTSKNVLSDEQNYLQSKLRKETWQALEHSLESGICSSIGVSNYEIKHLKELEMYAKELPSVNQIELHPHFVRKKLVKYCVGKHIVVEAYGSIVPKGDTSLLKDDLIVGLSKKYSKTPAQILLRWAVQQGFVVIPKSLTKQHIADNSKIFDFELERNDLSAITRLDKDKRYFSDDSTAPVYDWKKHMKQEKMATRAPRHDEL